MNDGQIMHTLVILRLLLQLGQLSQLFATYPFWKHINLKNKKKTQNQIVSEKRGKKWSSFQDDSSCKWIKQERKDVNEDVADDAGHD